MQPKYSDYTTSNGLEVYIRIYMHNYIFIYICISAHTFTYMYIRSIIRDNVTYECFRVLDYL